MQSDVLMEADLNLNPSYIAMGRCTHARTATVRQAQTFLTRPDGMINCRDRFPSKRDTCLAS
jgi:hypothetical protein